MRFEMKKPIAILVTAVFLLSAIVVAASVTPASVLAATDPSSWYVTKSGVLSSDYYTLYPFESDASVKIGLSRFGEMIDSNTNTGLEYRGADPFAPPAGSGTVASIPKNLWINGWLLNITYYNRLLGWRNVWAAALFADAHNYGGDWIRVDNPNDYPNEYPKAAGYNIYGTGTYGTTLVYGGRKTNGTAYSYPIQILYDGPREFIAVARTDVWDHPSYMSNDTSADVPLVEIAITYVFNKDTKEVNLLKDVKSILPLKEGETMKVQFGDRGEVDLGDTKAGFASYGHFYTQGTAPNATDPQTGLVVNDTLVEGLPTVYNSSWELIQTEDPNVTENAKYVGDTTAGPYPQSKPVDVTSEYGTVSGEATVDVAECINPDANGGDGLVWWAAFWPSLSDWSINGWDQWWHSLSVWDPHYIDVPNAPSVPFYIGEWDFILYYTGDPMSRTQFRGVTQYGICDWHDGYLPTMADGVATSAYAHPAEDMATPVQQARWWEPDFDRNSAIDDEAWYYITMKFNPWDLLSAANKSTERQLAFATGNGNYDGSDYTTGTPVHMYDDAIDAFGMWDAYAGFAERVENLTSGKLLVRWDDYYYQYSGGHHYVYIYDTSKSDYKVTWSSDAARFVNNGEYETVDSAWDWIVVGRDAASVDSAGAALMAANSIRYPWIEIGIAGADMWNPVVANQMPSVMAKLGSGDTVAAYKDAAMTGTSSPGLRAALKDDWCTYWPITTANIMGIGGPIANMLSYYSNDFMQTLWGLPQFTSGSPYQNTLAPITCWARAWPQNGGLYNTYTSNSTVGYATISTTIDQNGTVIYSVYGIWGRDTYYATQWIYGDEQRDAWTPGYWVLMHMAPGITSIILKIDYTDPKHPTFCVVEQLGTVSETWLGNYDTNCADIHDP